MSDGMADGLAVWMEGGGNVGTRRNEACPQAHQAPQLGPSVVIPRPKGYEAAMEATPVRWVNIVWSCARCCNDMVAT